MSTKSQDGERSIRILAEGLGFTEGPVALADGGFVITSLTLGAVHRIEREGGSTRLADVGGGANGAAVDRDGALFIAQSGGRWVRDGPVWPREMTGGVQRIDPDGNVSWVSQDPISPNDICFGPDGLLYVTDPTRAPQLRDARVWRIDPETGAAELLFSVPWFANGLAFGPDDVLHLASTYESRIYAVDVLAGSTTPLPVIQMTEGQPDGMAFDSQGRIVIGSIDATRRSAGSLQTWSTTGELVDVFRPGPDCHYTNLAFDGRGGLVVTSSDAESVLLVDDWGDLGLPLHPFRQGGVAG